MSKLIFRSPVQHVAAITEYAMTAQELADMLMPLNLQASYLWDGHYWHPSLEDWGKILKDVCFGMPAYTTDRFDCENFAMLTSARVSERYLLNTCGVAVGFALGGGHGFNLLVTESGLIYFEPQSGDFIHIDDGSYKAEIVIFGG